jgi:hypothetical protein
MGVVTKTFFTGAFHCESAFAGVAKFGLRRGAQDPVAKAFVGSNPTSRTMT